MGVCAECLKRDVANFTQKELREGRDEILRIVPDAIVVFNGTGYCLLDFAYFIGGVSK